MRKRLVSFWQNYKFRFVPWIVLNLKQKRATGAYFPETNHEPTTTTTTGVLKGNNGSNNNEEASSLNLKEWRNPVPDSNNNNNKAKLGAGPVIVHHVEKGKDKLIPDQVLLDILIALFEKFSKLELDGDHHHGKNSMKEASRRNQEIMHDIMGYSIERRKSLVSNDAGTGVFLASGHAKPGSLIALYPGAIYMPREPLFFPSIGNPFIFRCSDGLHIDGNDKWISKSILKSCAARDKFRVDLPCCDESWLTSTPLNPLNIGQYVNNRSKSAINNVVYQESSVSIALSLSNPQNHEFPVHLCKYLPNVWANPGNNHHPLRLVPLVAVRDIYEGDEILSSYFTLVHAKQGDKLESK